MGTLSDWLAAASSEREQMAADLSSELKTMGESPRLDLHEGGILHKGWVDLEQHLRSTEKHLRSTMRRSFASASPVSPARSAISITRFYGS
jgi:hypothetical protein